MLLTVSYDSGLSRFGHRLSTLADRIDRAKREGLREGGELVRTSTRRVLRHQLNTRSQGAINKRTSGNLEGDDSFVIRGVGPGLPITDFPVRGGKKRQGNWRDQPRDGHGRFGELPDNEAGKVVAQSWGAAHRFKRSFATAGGRFVARLPGTRSLRRLYGPSVAKEIVLDDSAANFEATAAPLVQAAIIKRIGRLL